MAVCLVIVVSNAFFSDVAGMRGIGVKILYLHGWRSVPGGVKPAWLRSRGHDVSNPLLDADDLQRAVRQAEAAFLEQRPDVIVGASRGAVVAQSLACPVTPRVLLCPAWKRWSPLRPLTGRVLILHSPEDEIVPWRDSVELAELSGLSRDVLISVGSDHRLGDEDSLEVLQWACGVLLADEQIPVAEEEPAGRPRAASAAAEASYICDSCGEEIVIPVDVCEGDSQVLVEDCPVCCRANTIYLALHADGGIESDAEH